jgi:hypothetical protein
VISHAHQAGRVGFDKIDGSAKLNPAVERDSAGERSRIGGPLRVSGREAERELEVLWHKAGIIKAGAPQPFAQIRANGGDAVHPDAPDRGGEVVVVACGYVGKDTIELVLGAVETARTDGKQAFPPKPGEQFELDVVDERPALQRVEFIDGLRFEARCKVVDRV